MPRFTVVTATHGRPDELREAISSVLAQDYEDFEHLVVDDGSPDDGAARIVGELNDPRVRVIRLDPSRGPAGARNAGIAQARGELVAILDDDDCMRPGRLRLTAARFDDDPELVMVGGAFDVVDEFGTFHVTVRAPTDEAALRALLPDGMPVGHVTLTFRADTLKAVGGYRTELRYAHDYDLVLRVAERGPIAALPESLTAARYFTRGITGKRFQLQGQYAAVARTCAARRAAGAPERLAEQVAAIVPGAEASARRARARLQYQLGEWKFREGRVAESRPHFRAAFWGEPTRPLAFGLMIASHTPAFLRRLLGPLVRPLVARRYKAWR